MKTLVARGMVALTLMAISLTPSAKADEWDKQTKLEVKGGVIQIQGTRLAPGTYILKLADSQTDRRIVQLYNEDQTKLQATILADAAYRDQPTGDTRFTFTEIRGGQPPAISTWFYPGDNYGLRFSVR